MYRLKLAAARQAGPFSEASFSAALSMSCGLGPVTGGVVFSKLSKLLNQEDALSAPCLRGDRRFAFGPILYAIQFNI
jgi:hypothetical protein